MRLILTSITLAVLCLSSPVPSSGQGGKATMLDASTPMTLTNARILWVEYRGRQALKLAPREGHERDQDQEMIALLTGSDFHNGTIEVDVAGARRPGYSTTNDSTGFKGFIGISFRVRGDSAERFYLRPENSRGMTSCSGIAPPSTRPTPALRGCACARRVRGCTSHTWTSSPGAGRR